MNTILSLMSNFTSPRKEVSPIDNGYIPVNARTLDTRNKDFYINIQQQTPQSEPVEESQESNNYLDLLKKQIDYSKEEFQTNLDSRRRELMEQTIRPMTEQIRNEALNTYQTIEAL